MMRTKERVPRIIVVLAIFFSDGQRSYCSYRIVRVCAYYIVTMTMQVVHCTVSEQVCGVNELSGNTTKRGIGIRIIHAYFTAILDTVNLRVKG